MFSADGQYITMWTDIQRPTDISVDKDGIFYVSEMTVNELPNRVSVLDKQGSVLARWESRFGHGLWVDFSGDIYLALVGDRSVDEYVRQT